MSDYRRIMNGFGTRAMQMCNSPDKDFCLNCKKEDCNGDCLERATAARTRKANLKANSSKYLRQTLTSL